MTRPVGDAGEDSVGSLSRATTGTLGPYAGRGRHRGRGLQCRGLWL